jgi:hypothetical protein
MEGIKRYDNFLTPEESNIISCRILFLEEDVKKMGPDIFGLTNSNSLSGRHWCFNFLNDKVIGPIMIPKLKKLFDRPFIVQCWANTFRKGEGIGNHRHSELPLDDFYAAGNIFLRGDPTIGTYYEGVKHVNKVGELSLLSGLIYHSVPPNPTDDIRVTMAIDVYIGSDEEMMNRLANEPNRNRFVYIE